MISRTIVNSFTSLLGPRLTVSLTGRLGGTAHAVDRLLEGEALDRGVVDLDDQVAGQQAGARRRRIVDRADDAHETAVLHHLQPEAAEFLAPHRGLEFVELLGIEIVRMRIERGEHAVDGRLGHLRLVGLVDEKSSLERRLVDAAGKASRPGGRVAVARSDAPPRPDAGDAERGAEDR